MESNEHLLTKNTIFVDSVKNRDYKLNNYLYQKPNSNLLGFPLRLGIYNLARKTPDSFYIEIIVRNFGRSVSEEVSVSAIRTLEDGTVITYDPQTYDRVLFQDTLQYVINKDPL
ncbi:MAG: hypothetical protein HRT68_11295, partial [Flavobacteriaceae bacterium]|nr:hypothetical protein [Flavobacteriaceae bacterium]